MSSPSTRLRVAEQVVRRCVAAGVAAELYDVRARYVEVVVAGPWSDQEHQASPTWRQVSVWVADGPVIGSAPFHQPRFYARATTAPVGGWPTGRPWRVAADRATGAVLDGS